MKPPFNYYGGKIRLAPWIVSMFPNHKVYLEPFAGSCAVLFAKPPSTHEVINDVDGDVVNFFTVLRDHPGELERACRLTPYSRDEFNSIDLAVPCDDPIERARRWWVRLTQSYASLVTPHASWSVSTRQNAPAAGSVQNGVARMEACALRLSRVAIEHRPAIDLVRDHATADTLIYLDPPYERETRNITVSVRGDYRHDMPEADQHRELADVLRTTPATVFLSGYPSALYDELYGDWWTTERNVNKNVGALNGVSGRATERIWSNRPINAQGVFALSGPPPPIERTAT